MTSLPNFHCEYKIEDDSAEYDFHTYQNDFDTPTVKRHEGKIKESEDSSQMIQNNLATETTTNYSPFPLLTDESPFNDNSTFSVLAIQSPLQCANDCVTGSTRNWPCRKTASTPNCRCGLIDLLISNTCNCCSFEYDLNWNEECFDSIHHSKMHSVFNDKRKKLEKEIEILTPNLDVLDGQFRECQNEERLEMSIAERTLKTVFDLCNHIQQLECKINAIKTEVCGPRQTCNKMDTENFCCKTIIKSISKMQAERDKIRSDAILQSSLLQMCRDSKQRLEIENHVLMNDIKKVIEIAKEYTEEIRNITNEICASPNPDSPLNAILTAASPPIPISSGETTNRPDASGGFTSITTRSSTYRVSSRISTKETSTDQTSVTEDELQDEHKRNDKNDKYPKGGWSTEDRHSNTSDMQSRKNQVEHRESRRSRAQARQSARSGGNRAKKQQNYFQKDNQLKTINYSDLNRITTEANKIIAANSGKLQSEISDKPLINKFPNNMEYKGIVQQDKIAKHQDEAIDYTTKLLPKNVGEDTGEYPENLQLTSRMFKKLDIVKSAIQTDNKDLLRELNENQQKLKQAELENEALLAINQSLQNHVRNFTKGYQSPDCLHYIQKIGNLKAELFNLTRHNENNCKNYIDCRSKLEQCHCLLQRCIDEMKKRPDEPDIRKPSETASTQTWINYSNVLLDIINETKLNSFRNVFVSKLFEKGRDNLKRERDRLRENLELSEKRIDELIHQYTGEPLQYQIDALTKKTENLNILINEYESANQQLIREKEETEKKLKNLEDKSQMYELEIKQYSKVKEEKEALNFELEERKVEVNKLAGELKSFRQTINDLKLKLEKYNINLSEANPVNKELTQVSNRTLNRALQHKQNDPLNTVIANSFRLQIDQQTNDICQMQIFDQTFCNDICSNIEGIVTNPENENIASELQNINLSFDQIKNSITKSALSVKSEELDPKVQDSSQTKSPSVEKLEQLENDMEKTRDIVKYICWDK